MNSNCNTMLGLVGLVVVPTFIFSASSSPEALKCFIAVAVFSILGSIDCIRPNYTRFKVDAHHINI